jgi:hypothetical protein
MNINTLDYAEFMLGSSLDADIREHHEVLVGAGCELTGEYILIPEGVNFPGAMQVWSKKSDGRWMWVDTLGVIHERENPLIEEPVSHITKTNPTGEVRQCDARTIHEPHEWQAEFGAYFNAYCPGNTGR